MPARSIHVTGRVQGVFFRATAQEKATALGLTGWVRNTRQGSLEIFAEGEETALRELTDWCREGPPAADVQDVKVREAEEEGLPDFSVIR